MAEVNKIEEFLRGRVISDMINSRPTVMLHKADKSVSESRIRCESETDSIVWM